MIKLIKNENFKTKIKGKQVDLYTLKNDNGITAQITNYGGRVVSLWVPDKQGDYQDIVLGYKTIDGYLNSNEIYFGALIGRYGNRIAKGKFVLNNSVYKLATNNDANHLHGGVNGFNNIVWGAKQISDSKLELTYLSKDGEEGYPGNLNVKVIYKLTNNNELQIEYIATTDKATPVNLTHHSYFNLLGAGKGSINNHLLQIKASRFTPINDVLIPTGELKDVKNTPFDFTKPTKIAKHINDEVDQIKYGFGYDHNFVLDGTGLRLVAKVEEPISGRILEVITNEPGMQFYSGNFLNGKDVGKENLPYKYREAFCLETQHFPNSPNQLNFPSTILKPRNTYQSTCIYKFSIKE
ncbi:galactose mutarotase [Sabulilitoribacter arenilitoris]|uniref:Aldose 1-epimerase n=1 Tax=Wocania arenilitoris TaxID=2044858 RepID=A0AAE3JL40_9FLAO|nr:aldose epimerase family protein [Wocania arenilitoris]MCF7567849.1 galactose mutarotase [Wocania arenilitoris]